MAAGGEVIKQIERELGGERERGSDPLPSAEPLDPQTIPLNFLGNILK